MDITPSRRLLLWGLLAVTVAANCLPWVPYRVCGSGIAWRNWDGDRSGEYPRIVAWCFIGHWCFVIGASFDI
jgi:hypothetical protein